MRLKSRTLQEKGRITQKQYSKTAASEGQSGLILAGGTGTFECSLELLKTTERRKIVLKNSIDHD